MKGEFHLAVFAKAPVAGQAKTRLIPALGAARAAQIQEQMTRHALEMACMAAPGQVSLWTAGDPAHPFFQDCAARFKVELHTQHTGDLGARMAHTLRSMAQRQRPVLLIGSDCPVLSRTDLEAAALALIDGAAMVFIPAEDGGYVLVGMQHGITGVLEEAIDAVFTDMPWSSAEVMCQTRARLLQRGWRQGTEWVELPTRWDVDLPDDYERACAAGLLHRIVS